LLTVRNVIAFLLQRGELENVNYCTSRQAGKRKLLHIAANWKT
jgi:hypothetical protein